MKQTGLYVQGPLVILLDIAPTYMIDLTTNGRSLSDRYLGVGHIHMTRISDYSEEASRL